MEQLNPQQPPPFMRPMQGMMPPGPGSHLPGGPQGAPFNPQGFQQMRTPSYPIEQDEKKK